MGKSKKPPILACERLSTKKDKVQAGNCFCTLKNIRKVKYRNEIGPVLYSLDIGSKLLLIKKDQHSTCFFVMSALDYPYGILNLFTEIKSGTVGNCPLFLF